MVGQTVLDPLGLTGFWSKIWDDITKPRDIQNVVQNFVVSICIAAARDAVSASNRLRCAQVKLRNLQFFLCAFCDLSTNELKLRRSNDLYQANSDQSRKDVER